MPRGFGTTLGAGTTDLIQTRSIPALANQISVSIWYYLNGVGGSSLGRLWNRTGFDCLYDDGGSNIGFSRTNSGGTVTAKVTYPQVKDFIWHHLLVVHDQTSGLTTPTIWLDGQVKSTSASSANPGTDGAAVINLGNGSAGTRNLDGFLAYFTLWQGVLLTAGEAQALAAGAHPILIQPQAITSCIPMDGVSNPEMDLGSGMGFVSSQIGTKLGSRYAPVQVPRVFFPLVTPTVTSQTASPTGIASTSAVGSPTVLGVTTINPGAAPIAYGVGSVGLTEGSVSRSPSGIASVAGIGTPTITTGEIVIIPPSVIAPQGIGTPTHTQGSVTASPTGIASVKGIGTPTHTQGSVTVSPTSVVAPQGIGTPTHTQGSVTVSPSGVASVKGIGSPTITGGSVTVSPASVTAPQGIGIPSVSLVSGTQTVHPASVLASQGIGAPTHTQGSVTVSPAGIASVKGVGAPSVTAGSLTVSPVGIASVAAIGIPTRNQGSVTISPLGIPSATALGVVTTTPRMHLIGIPSQIAIGAPTVSVGIIVANPAGLPPAHAIGVVDVTGGVVNVRPVGIDSTIVLGVPSVGSRIQTRAARGVTLQMPDGHGIVLGGGSA